MVNVPDIVKQLKEEHDRLSKQIKGIAAAISAFGSSYGGTRHGSTISAEGRARIAAAQKARWANAKRKGSQSTLAAAPKKRTMSAASRKAIAKAQRERWARIRAQKKS